MYESCVGMGRLFDICAGSPQPTLLAYAINTKFLWACFKNFSDQVKEHMTCDVIFVSVKA